MSDLRTVSAEQFAAYESEVQRAIAAGERSEAYESGLAWLQRHPAYTNERHPLHEPISAAVANHYHLAHGHEPLRR